MDVRDEVLKALEEARKEKVIGNSLGAAVHLYPNEAYLQLTYAIGAIGSVVHRVCCERASAWYGGSCQKVPINRRMLPLLSL